MTNTKCLSFGFPQVLVVYLGGDSRKLCEPAGKGDRRGNEHTVCLLMSRFSL